MNVQPRIRVPRQRPAGLPRHGPAGARRRLRPGGLCAEPRAGGARRQAASERARARLGDAEARRLRAERDRGARHLRLRHPGTRRSTCSSTAAPGGATRRPTTRCRPSRWSAPARIASSSTSSTSTRPAATCFRCTSRCGARSPGCARNAESFGGDRDRIYVSAHSSGSHLAGVRADARLAARRACRRTRSRARCCCQRHVRSQAGAAVEALGLCEVHRRDGGAAERAAPSRRAQHAADPRHGTCETPEFQRQSRDFAAAVKAAGKPVELIVGEGYNHFELLETLANPYGLHRPRDARADEARREIE